MFLASWDRLGLVLGNYKVNIGHLSLGRIKEKKIALNIFNLDSEIGEGVIQELKRVKGVIHVYTAGM